MKILAIDGGGIRGLIPAVVLADLERRTGRRTAEMFDLIAGTSTGGILACGLTRPGDGGAPAFTAADLIGLYESEGPEIFHRSLVKRIESVDGYVDERYDDVGLNAALRRYLDGTRLSQAVTDLFITAYEIERREAFFFRSSRARDRPDATTSRSSTRRARRRAAPTYFEPARVSDVAGAASYALDRRRRVRAEPGDVRVRRARGGAAARDEIELVVSLGTGSHTRRLPFEDVRGWGQLEWARPLIDVVFDGLAADGRLRARPAARARALRALPDAARPRRATTSTTRATATSRRCAARAAASWRSVRPTSSASPGS